MGKLEGRVAVITGGTKGIGEQAVRMMAREGAKVLYMGLEDAPQIADELNAEGCDVTFFKGADMMNKSDIEAFTKAALDKYGKVDVLFLHAGLGLQGKIEEMPMDEWYWYMDLNLNHNMYTIRQVLPSMMKNNYGSIIFTSSIAGLVGRPGGPNMPAYCASKAAQSGLARSIACDYGKYNIRCNVVCPGIIDTDVYHFLEGPPDFFNGEIPMGRPGRPEEVASLVTFLAGNEATYITGTTIPVDGGCVIC